MCSCHSVWVPRFEPFRALRYATDDIGAVTSPPYDVFDENTRADYAAQHAHNVVHVDYPVESDGDARYESAAHTLAQWISTAVLVTDATPSFSLYRMSFTDDAGRPRSTVGVIGALEVVDVGGSGVLPHERTTPKAKTDRLDLTRATRANLSPVWGLSLTAGLTSLLEEPGDLVSSFVDNDGVTHQIERVSQPTRISAIRYAVSSHPVLIADGHHRYAISRTYRDEQRSQSGDNASELTMTYVAELVEEQLSVAAIHRLYDLSPSQLISALEGFYVPRAAGPVSGETLQTMDSTSCMCLVDASGNGTFLEPVETAFPGVREMDSARLEYALRDTTHAVQYQHGVDEVLHAIHTGVAQCAVLIRPVSIDEIRRTAHTGDLMPPKSTFFTPKLRTGLVMRSLDA